MGGDRLRGRRAAVRQSFDSLLNHPLSVLGTCVSALSSLCPAPNPSLPLLVFCLCLDEQRPRSEASVLVAEATILHVVVGKGAVLAIVKVAAFGVRNHPVVVRLPHLERRAVGRKVVGHLVGVGRIVVELGVEASLGGHHLGVLRVV